MVEELAFGPIARWIGHAVLRVLSLGRYSRSLDEESLLEEVIGGVIVLLGGLALVYLLLRWQRLQR